MKFRIAAIIPARLSSTRFPNKVLFDFCGLPMIEHVRKRAEISQVFNAGVFVATCDEEIYDLITLNGGNCIMTSNFHHSGSSRASEAVDEIDCTHVVIIQGDEPLILPDDLKKFVNAVESSNDYFVWNGVSNILIKEDFKDTSIVKSVANKNGEIIFFHRGNPYISSSDFYKEFSKKVLGLICFEKNTLKKINFLDKTLIETSENIEQLHILMNSIKIKSVELGESYPSVNLIEDALKVQKYLSADEIQIEILNMYNKPSNFE